MSLSDIEMPSNRKFGFFFTIIFILMSACFFYSHVLIPSILLFSIAFLFLLAAILKPDLLFIFNKSWMYLGLFLAMIISPIVLGIIYFGLFTPMAIFMQLARRDELRLKMQSGQSYWRRRTSADSETKTFKHQF